MNDNNNEKSKSRRIFINILTILIIILFLGMFIGMIYALIELVPIPNGFDNKWDWYFYNPYVYTNACPFGLKVLIFGGLMACLFIGLTFSIYLWKKGKPKLLKLIYGEEN
ncbi:MAG: hypothetical protein GF329_12560 [Candidatus Lokiarchaeota archaeon]|nr:hypothetical protein [Candidatus Lokiarchaeota archaeon]